MMKRLLIFNMIIISLILSGCAPKDSDTLKAGEMADSGGNVRICSYYPDSLNPLETEIDLNFDMLMLIYDGLFKVESDHRAKPVLADGLSVSSDAIVYKIMLKDGVTFHDGAKFNAADVMFTINLMREYAKFDSFFALINNITAVGDRAIEITLNQPSHDFANRLDFPILPKNAPTEAFVPIGTGRYVYGGNLRQKELILTKNADWHGGNVNINSVTVAFADDAETIRYMFASGETDIITADAFEQSEMNFANLHKKTQYISDFYNFIDINMSNTALTDVNVRRALACSVDTNSIAKMPSGANGTAAILPVNPAAYYFSAIKKDIYGQKTAKTILGSTGWLDINNDGFYDKTGGGTMISLMFEMLINTDDAGADDIAESVKQSFAKSGIGIKITAVSSEEYAQKVADRSYDLCLARTKMEAGYGPLQMNNAENFSDDMKTALDNIAKCTTDDKITEVFAAFAECFANEIPHIPLFFENCAVFTQNRISGTSCPGMSSVYCGLENLVVREESE